MTTVPKAFRALLCALALAAAAPAALAQASPPAAERSGARDFDFELGSWKCHLSRRLKPLTGSNTWVEYDGTSVLRPVWGGKANLGELELDGSTGHLEGLSLRVYNPQTRQWGISYANSAAGAVGLPMFGGFKEGRGEFYAADTLNDRAIFVRFVFSDITARSFQLEQAFSDDGGKTWEPNWIAKFTR
ncbi:hypothetical protein [Phenylobacterium sp.]|uniref:hypothetical protein n=1 Tax=Phenylobacterium sp. TaxID=1871053 RepID=UPI00356B592B